MHIVCLHGHTMVTPPGRAAGASLVRISKHELNVYFVLNYIYSGTYHIVRLET